MDFRKVLRLILPLNVTRLGENIFRGRILMKFTGSFFYFYIITMNIIKLGGKKYCPPPPNKETTIHRPILTLYSVLRS